MQRKLLRRRPACMQVGLPKIQRAGGGANAEPTRISMRKMDALPVWLRRSIAASGEFVPLREMSLSKCRTRSTKRHGDTGMMGSGWLFGIGRALDALHRRSDRSGRSQTRVRAIGDRPGSVSSQPRAAAPRQFENWALFDIAVSECGLPGRAKLGTGEIVSACPLHIRGSEHVLAWRMPQADAALLFALLTTRGRFVPHGLGTAARPVARNRRQTLHRTRLRIGPQRAKLHGRNRSCRQPTANVSVPGSNARRSPC